MSDELIYLAVSVWEHSTHFPTEKKFNPASPCVLTLLLLQCGLISVKYGFSLQL